MPRTYTLLSPETEKQIRRLMKTSTSVWEYRRLQCVSLRRVGLTADDVARIVGLHRSSVLRVWSLFQRGGVDALLQEKRGQVRGRARKKIDITATYRLLGRHDWRKIVPRAQHPKADAHAQETFKIFFPHTGYVGEARRAPLWAPFPVDVLG